MQIASGFVSLEGDDNGDKVEIEVRDNPKDAALYELLGDVSGSSKVIIWCSFRANYKSVASVCKRLDLRYVEIHGGISAKEKDAAVESFNKDAAVKVLIGNASAAGEGISLTASDVSIFYSRTFSWGADTQAEARNYRGGSHIHDKVTRYDLVMENTIEEHIAEKLACKEAISESVLRDLVLGIV
jgi:SNF2 family DNA or RNA helicase